MTTRDEDDLPDDREPGIWARLLALVILLLVAAGVLVASTWVVGLVDAFLTAQLGKFESTVTTYVAFGTWLLCQFRARPRRTP